MLSFFKKPFGLDQKSYSADDATQDAKSENTGRSRLYQIPTNGTCKNSESSAISNQELQDTIYDCIRTIRDPEKPATLEDLHVVSEDCIQVLETDKGMCFVRVEFNPTVPHCSLATLIGLCIRVKLQRNLERPFKLDVYIKEGTHATEKEINKQINDKERTSAAMENPNLKEMVENCIKEEE